MRTIHSERNSRFLFLRPTYANLRAFSMASCGGSGTCHALRPHAGLPLVGDHTLQHRLVGGVRQHAFVKLPLTLARLRSQDVTSKSMVPYHLAGPRLLEPLRRTFVSLQLGHRFPES